MSKKRFYLFLLLPIFLAITVLFVGCGNSYMGLATRWLPENTPETSFFEKSDYTARAYSQTNADGLTFDLKQANFSQTVEGKKDFIIDSPLISDGILLPRDVYKYTTLVTMQGEYTYQGQTIKIDDKVDTTVYFAISTEGFKPLTSTQTIKSTTPVKNYNTKKYEFVNYDYAVEKFYNGDASAVRVQITQNPNSKAVPSETKEINNLNKNNAPYDNGQLYFIARAMRDQLNTVNAITENGVLPTSMNLSTKKEKLTVPNEAEKEYDVTNVTLSVAGNGIGKGPAHSLTLLSTEKYKHFIYRIREVMPYALGAITFTLTSISDTASNPTP